LQQVDKARGDQIQDKSKVHAFGAFKNQKNQLVTITHGCTSKSARTVL